MILRVLLGFLLGQLSTPELRWLGIAAVVITVAFVSLCCWFLADDAY